MKNRELCVICNSNLRRLKCTKPDGAKIYHTKCSGCSPYKKKQRQYGDYNKKHYCDFCGFVAVDLCQLDVDHIDGDHENNSTDNLQTLCANCHRLKTKLNRDYYVVPT